MKKASFSTRCLARIFLFVAALAVIAYGGEFTEVVGVPLAVDMKTVRIFDPLNGTTTDEDWPMFSQTVTGTWLPTIARRDGCDFFGPNGFPPGCEPPVRGSERPAPVSSQSRP